MTHLINKGNTKTDVIGCGHDPRWQMSLFPVLYYIFRQGTLSEELRLPVEDTDHEQVAHEELARLVTNMMPYSFLD